LIAYPFIFRIATGKHLIEVKDIHDGKRHCYICHRVRVSITKPQTPPVEGNPSRGLDRYGGNAFYLHWDSAVRDVSKWGGVTGGRNFTKARKRELAQE
jgi:hypothetical protein